MRRRRIHVCSDKHVGLRGQRMCCTVQRTHFNQRQQKAAGARIVCMCVFGCMHPNTHIHTIVCLHAASD
jgi:hypothetical protein